MNKNLSIQHDSTENASVVHGSPEIIKSLLMVSMSAMREVEASHVHPSSQKPLQHIDRPRRRSQSAHNLSLSLALRPIKSKNLLHYAMLSTT